MARLMTHACAGVRHFFEQNLCFLLLPSTTETLLYDSELKHETGQHCFQVRNSWKYGNYKKPVAGKQCIFAVLVWLRVTIFD